MLNSAAHEKWMLIVQVEYEKGMRTKRISDGLIGDIIMRGANAAAREHKAVAADAVP